MKKTRFFLSICSLLLQVTSFAIISQNINSIEEEGTVIHAFDFIPQEPDLINLIYKVDPQLRVCKNPLEIATRLLPIICDLSITIGGTYNNVTNINHNRSLAQEYYSQAIRKYEIIQCGGKSVFLKNILNEYFNLQSFTMNMGKLGTPHTHVVTIIPIKQAQGYRFYLFDAHFGAFFTDSDGNILDLESILSGHQFGIKFIKFKQKILIDSNKDFSNNIPTLSFEKKLNDSIYICSYISDLFFNSLCPHENCSWRETLILHYLDIGKVLGLSMQKNEITKSFFDLLNRFQIEY